MSKEPFFVIFSHFFVLDFEKFGRFEASHMTVDETHLTVQYHVTSLNQSKHSLAVGDGIKTLTWTIVLRPDTKLTGKLRKRLIPNSFFMISPSYYLINTICLLSFFFVSKKDPNYNPI